MFTTNQTIVIDIVCDNQLIAQRLEGSGYIQFHTQCLVEHADMVIQTFKTLTTHSNSSFTPAFNLSDVLQDEGGHLKLEVLSHGENLKMKLLDDRLKELRESPPISTIDYHDIHHYISIYVLLATIIVGIGTYIVIDRRRRIPKLTAPTPMPRREDVESA